MVGISLITPTGGRPEAFALCERWVFNQTYQGQLQWIVVDDVDPPVVSTYNWGSRQTIIRPSWRWRKGQNTQGKNLLAALDLIQYDKVLVIEDDDYYAPEYVERMAGLLNEHDLIGEKDSIYYHLPSRSYYVNNNAGHASLCQTGFTKKIINPIKTIFANYHNFYDIRIWKLDATKNLTKAGLVVGMKGLPGRPGIGTGHSPVDYKPDSELEVLCSLVGNDIEHYQWLLNPQ